MWRYIIITILTLSITAAAGSRLSPDEDRPMFARISLVKGKRTQAPQVIFDNKAWNVATCQQRMTSNRLDGDARFIVGCYSLLQKEYEKAVEFFTLTIPLRYKDFSEKTMLEGLGCAYHELGKAARRRQAANEFFDFLQKELGIYAAFCRTDNRRDSHFCYLYALTYIDLGAFLSEQKGKDQPTQVLLTDLQKRVDSRTAFEQAAQILESIPGTDTKVYDQRIIVYKRLGLSEKADETARIQSQLAREAAFSRLREPVRLSILKSLKPQDVLTPSFQSQYSALIRQKHSNGHPIDEQARTLLKTVATAIVQDSKEASKLSAENREILIGEISTEISQKIRNTVHQWEAEHVWNSINSQAFEKRDYAPALAQLNEMRELLLPHFPSKKIASLEKEIRSRISLQQRMIAEQKAAEQEVARRASAPPEPAVEHPPRHEPLPAQRPVREKEPSRPGSGQGPAQQTQPTVDPEQVRICSHIEELIRQKDFVAAYRGISVYDAIVRKRYGGDYTDSLIRELETAIFKKHGETFLRDLKRDLKR